MVIRGLESLKKKYHAIVLTIGNFDGVHTGHQKVFRAVAERAKALKGTSAAITFDPHPLSVVAPERGIRMLTTFDEKARLMEHYGIDVILCINFNREFAHTEAKDFIRDVILAKLDAKEIIVGHGYAFGKNKKGTAAFLRRRGKASGFAVRVIRNARSAGDVVSSSRIRSLLGRGRVYEASLLLGRPYVIQGRVIRGAGRGSGLLHIPTANISTHNEIVPAEGVYAVRVVIGRKVLDGAASIGKNPTFGQNPISYEVHIFDFSEDILGRDIRIYFIDRIRDERTFPDAGTLRDVIIRDIECAKDILKTKGYPELI